MSNSKRRAAIKQIGFMMLGGNMLLQACSDAEKKPESANSQDSTKTAPVSKSVKESKPILVAKGSFPAAPDGTLVGDGKESGTKIRAEYTNSQLCCQEILIPPKQAGPPPHLHHELDEAMRVLEGTVSVLVGDDVVELHEGDWHIRPHGIIHTFWNSSDKPARIIDLYPNQDLITFFEDFLRMQKRLQNEGISMQSPEFQKLNGELLQKFGIEMFPEKFPPLLKKYGLTSPFA